MANKLKHPHIKTEPVDYGALDRQAEQIKDSINRLKYVATRTESADKSTANFYDYSKDGISDYFKSSTQALNPIKTKPEPVNDYIDNLQSKTPTYASLTT